MARDEISISRLVGTNWLEKTKKKFISSETRSIESSCTHNDSIFVKEIMLSANLLFFCPYSDYLASRRTFGSHSLHLLSSNFLSTLFPNLMYSHWYFLTHSLLLHLFSLHLSGIPAFRMLLGDACVSFHKLLHQRQCVLNYQVFPVRNSL